MGMFDSVMVPCPDCQEPSEFQSKSGDCILGRYTLDSAPANVLGDINRHSPNKCEKCGTLFQVELTVITKIVKV